MRNVARAFGANSCQLMLHLARRPGSNVETDLAAVPVPESGSSARMTGQFQRNIERVDLLDRKNPVKAA